MLALKQEEEKTLLGVFPDIEIMFCNNRTEFSNGAQPLSISLLEPLDLPRTFPVCQLVVRHRILADQFLQIQKVKLHFCERLQLKARKLSPGR